MPSNGNHTLLLTQAPGRLTDTGRRGTFSFGAVNVKNGLGLKVTAEFKGAKQWKQASDQARGKH